MPTVDLQTTVRIVIETCCQCGVVFGMNEAVYRRARESRAEFFCTAGHPQRYVESDVARLTRKLAEKDQQLAAQKEQTKQVEQKAIEMREQRDAADRRTSAQKAVVTRLKNKAAKGHCPCCDQLFPDLESHMKDKHPDYETQEEAAPE